MAGLALLEDLLAGGSVALLGVGKLGHSGQNGCEDQCSLELHITISLCEMVRRVDGSRRMVLRP